MEKKISVAAFILVVFTITSTTMWGVNKADMVQHTGTQITKANKAVVKVSPNPTKDGVVAVNSNLPKEELNFYVFDLEGTLLHQLTLVGTKEHKISKLNKGTYIYEVFQNNVSVEQGKIFAN
jgi:hypothetical protein